MNTKILKYTDEKNFHLKKIILLYFLLLDIRWHGVIGGVSDIFHLVLSRAAGTGKMEGCDHSTSKRPSSPCCPQGAEAFS